MYDRNICDYNLPSNRHQQYPVRNTLSKTNMLYHEFANNTRPIDAFQHSVSPRRRNPMPKKRETQTKSEITLKLKIKI